MIPAGSRALIAGVALILVTNVIVMTGALGNRAGEPEAMVELTERELGWFNSYYNRRENSGISLNLNTVLMGDDNWLDMAKLAGLGIDFRSIEDPVEQQRRISKLLPQDVFVVLEFDGSAYQADLKKAQAQVDEAHNALNANPGSENYQQRLQNAEWQLAHKINNDSRLYAIDVGRDPAELRQRHPDNTRYIIAAGLVRVSNYYEPDGTFEPYRGYIDSVHIDSIHVPLEHRAVFDNLPEPQYGEHREYPPRYQVTLAYGSRYEPWVRQVRSLY